MTFEAVMVSLIKQTESHPRNVALRWLESLGVLAGALVGVESISPSLATKSYGSWVAVTTGVFTPELRKRLIEDLDKYLTNLGNLALGSVIALGPNESKDGYVFFPRGPILGYGVDEFSVDKPSFIVSIDNIDVAVDGSLVTKDFQLASGIQSPTSQVEDARNKGRSVRDESLMELSAMNERMRSYRLTILPENVQQRLDKGDQAGATLLLGEFEKIYGPDTTGIVAGLRAKVQSSNQSCIAILGKTESKDIGAGLTVAGVANSNDIVWEYRIRLSKEVGGKATAKVVLHAVGSVDVSNIKVFIAKDAEFKNLFWPKMESDTGPTAELQFADGADPTSGAQAWYEPYYVRVIATKMKDNIEINVTHIISSSNLTINDSSRSLVLMLEKAQK